LQSLAEQAQKSNVEIVLVAANKNCEGLNIARKYNLQASLVDRAEYGSRAEHEEALGSRLQTVSPDWIFLAGYMAVISAAFIARFNGRILNIHPSLLPAFKGLDTHQRAIDAKVETHGVSIHLVTPVLDDGPIIAQASRARTTDNAGLLAQQVLEIEHLLYPAILAAMASKQLSLSTAPQDMNKIIWNDTASLQPVKNAGFLITHPETAS